MKLIIIALVLAVTTQARAGENIFYVGGGTSKETNGSSKGAFSLGFLNLSQDRYVWGLDFSQEGTMVDSTSHQNNAVKAGMSFNALIGANLLKTTSNRVDVAAIVGIREKGESCASSGQSYLGFQCYANATPDTKYAGNFGAVVAWTYKSAMLGVRITGESTQALLGVKF